MTSRDDATTTVTADRLFREWFLPLYPEDARADLDAARRTDANPAKNQAILDHLADAATTFAHMAAGVFEEDLALDGSDASVHRLSRALTRERRNAWMESEPAGSAESTLFNVVVHGAAYVGEAIRKTHGGAWSVRRPLWESVVTLQSRAGTADLAVFLWLLRSLGDEALGGGDAHAMTLADRYRTYVEVPCSRPEDLPLIAPPERSLPRITKVKYDVLYKYLKAHLPELRDLGEHFPAAERFAELGLKWLDAKLLGGGRMLLFYGLGTNGLHLFWLTAAGFEKAAFYPCETFPEPLVEIANDKLIVTVSIDGKPVRHEMLYWGP
jgi:hypothetical protein